MSFLVYPINLFPPFQSRLVYLINRLPPFHSISFKTVEFAFRMEDIIKAAYLFIAKLQ